MISGGQGEGVASLNSAEIYYNIYYNPADTSIGGCRIPNMPTSRFDTVTKEFLLCGGYGDHPRDCTIFNPESGRWEEAHKLNQERKG